jgi:hypothetical protein
LWRTVSEIKLKRTDTTLDLSHYGKGSWRGKGRKRDVRMVGGGGFIGERGGEFGRYSGVVIGGMLLDVMGARGYLQCLLIVSD